MNTNEMKKTDGGLPILKLRGFFDGKKGNTELTLFFWRVV
jgi:hypothetical protein